MPRSFIKLLIPLLLGTAALACALPALGGGSAPAQPDGGLALLFEDDFSDSTYGWNVKDTGDLILEYTNETFRIFVNNDAFSFVYQTAYLERSLRDVSIEVDVERVSGSDSANVYLVCRRADDDNFIAADVDSEGDVRIAVVLNDEQEIVSDAEGVGGLRDGVNRLRIDCIGDQVSLYVNGALVVSAQVGGPAGGGIGFAAGGAGEGRSDFRFDNLAVYAPD
jgi:hypothetical protein